jgi:hypothetical protein
MSEQGMRQKVVKLLSELGAFSVENPIRPGTPDVNYIEGWIELKWLRRYPRNYKESPILIEHFTPQQRIWLRKRWEKGGAAYLLLQVKKEWFLFTGKTASKMVGRSTYQELIGCAAAYWANGLNKEELIKCLRNKISD